MVLSQTLRQLMSSTPIIKCDAQNAELEI